MSVFTADLTIMVMPDKIIACLPYIMQPDLEPSPKMPLGWSRDKSGSFFAQSLHILPLYVRVVSEYLKYI